MIGEPIWTFWDFVYGDTGNNPVEAWYRELSFQGQVLFDAVLKDASKTQNFQDWMGWRKFLKGKKEREQKLWELEFSADGRAYRIIGAFGPGRRQATLLSGCYHKMNRYYPDGAIAAAVDRSKALSKGAKRVERKIKTSDVAD